MLILAAWAAGSLAAAFVIGRAIRLADQPTGLVPQMDDPLRRGTDLPVAGATADVGDLAGAVLGLAYATDDTTADYWLAMCAARGADEATLRGLLDEWERNNTPTFLPFARLNFPTEEQA